MQKSQIIETPHAGFVAEIRRIFRFLFTYGKTIIRLSEKQDAVFVPLLAYVLLRLLTATTALVVTGGQPVEPPEWIYYNSTGASYILTLPTSAPLYTVVSPWHRYDTLWYTKNALDGYKSNDPGIAFFPLYSILIRLIVIFCAGNYVLAALVVSNVSCIATFLLLYQLALFEFQDKVLARRTVLAMAAFPTAYYLVAGYTESLFLALVIGCFLLTLHRRWLFAALLAFLAGLTRFQGILLCLPLAWIAYVQYRPRGRLNWLVRLPVTVASLIGTGSYLLYLAINKFSLESVYTTEWKSSTNWPWMSVATYLMRLFNGQTLSYENDNAVALLIFCLLGLVVLRRLRPVYSIYVITTLGIFLARYYETVQLESMARYVLQLFPCFIALGLLFFRRWYFLAYLSFGLSAQIILVARFVQWIWVG